MWLNRGILLWWWRRCRYLLRWSGHQSTFWPFLWFPSSSALSSFGIKFRFLKCLVCFRYWSLSNKYLHIDEILTFLTNHGRSLFFHPNRTRVTEMKDSQQLSRSANWRFLNQSKELIFRCILKDNCIRWLFAGIPVTEGPQLCSRIDYLDSRDQSFWGRLESSKALWLWGLKFRLLVLKVLLTSGIPEILLCSPTSARDFEVFVLFSQNSSYNRFFSIWISFCFLTF